MGSFRRGEIGFVPSPGSGPIPGGNWVRSVRAPPEHTHRPRMEPATPHPFRAACGIGGESGRPTVAAAMATIFDNGFVRGSKYWVRSGREGDLFPPSKAIGPGRSRPSAPRRCIPSHQPRPRRARPFLDNIAIRAIREHTIHPERASRRPYRVPRCNRVNGGSRHVNAQSRPSWRRAGSKSGDDNKIHPELRSGRPVRGPRECVQPGDWHGLQNRRAGWRQAAGGFDSHALPPSSPRSRQAPPSPALPRQTLAIEWVPSQSSWQRSRRSSHHRLKPRSRHETTDSTPIRPLRRGRGLLSNVDGPAIKQRANLHRIFLARDDLPADPVGAASNEGAIPPQSRRWHPRKSPGPLPGPKCRDARPVIHFGPFRDLVGRQSSQFSTCKPGTCSKSVRLADNRSAWLTSAVAAIFRSLEPIRSF